MKAPSSCSPLNRTNSAWLIWSSMRSSFSASLPRQRASLVQMQGDYEAAWTPVLEALHAAGRLRADVKLARLLMFGALNWSVQWFDRHKGATLDELSDAALASEALLAQVRVMFPDWSAAEDRKSVV